MSYLFPLEGKDEEFLLSADLHEEFSNLPLVGKFVSADSVRHVTVLWGPPNSGKTSNADRLFREMPEADQKKTVCVCYDEDLGYEGSGAIFAIPAFKKAYDAAVALMKKVGRTSEVANKFLEAFRANRSDSQRVRSLTLNKANEQGFDLLIDTTSSSKGILIMCDILRKNTEINKTTEINFLGTTAPLPLAEERSKERNRPVEYKELYSKRIGAYETFPAIVSAADGFTLYSNPEQGKPAEKVWSYSKRSGVTYFDPDAYAKMKAYVLSDGEYIKNHKDPEVAAQHEKYVAAVSKMLAVIDASVRPSFTPRVKGAKFNP
jgi:hypothetical protein